MSGDEKIKKGKAYLVGAGPGDPGLLTVKAVKMIEEADVILYDKLVGEEIINNLKKLNKEMIYVGKRGGMKGVKRQNEIHSLIKKFAEQGKSVVRLKGGDPFLFGRGGIEAEFLIREGIDFEVVPGVSSISSVPTFAGIPLTHPDFSSSILVVTGRDDINAWSKAPLHGTIVILMGRDTIKDLCNRLIKAGRDPLTPVAVIENGTTPNQKILTGELLTISEKIKEKNLDGPALIVVGEVVRLYEIFNHK